MARARLERVPGARPEQVQQGSALELPFPDASFDRVVSIGCLHHTGDLARAVAEVRRVLRPGGELLLMVYNRHSARRVLLWPLLAVRHRLVAGAPTPEAWLRHANDGTADGDAAPHTDFVSVAELRGLLHGMHDVRIDRRSIDRVPLGPLEISRARLMRLGVDRLAGLDLYATARAARLSAWPTADVSRAQRGVLGRALRHPHGAPARHPRRVARRARALRRGLPGPLSVPARLLPAGVGRRAAGAGGRARLRHPERGAGPHGRRLPRAGHRRRAGGDGPPPAGRRAGRAAGAGAAGLGARAAVPRRLVRPRRLHRLPAPHRRPVRRRPGGAPRAAPGRPARADGLQPPLAAPPARAPVAALRHRGSRAGADEAMRARYDATRTAPPPAHRLRHRGRAARAVARLHGRPRRAPQHGRAADPVRRRGHPLRAAALRADRLLGLDLYATARR